MTCHGHTIMAQQYETLHRSCCVASKNNFSQNDTIDEPSFRDRSLLAGHYNQSSQDQETEESTRSHTAVHVSEWLTVWMAASGCVNINGFGFSGVCEVIDLPWKGKQSALIWTSQRSVVYRHCYWTLGWWFEHWRGEKHGDSRRTDSCTCTHTCTVFINTPTFLRLWGESRKVWAAHVGNV